MDDLITAAEAQKLLDGTTPGPWQADGDPWNRIVWSSAENRVCFMAHSSGLDDARDIATSNLVASAPALARTVIAQAAALDDAKAAQLAELRAALDEWKRLAIAGELTARNLAIVEAERSTLAARNRDLEAQVAGLVELRAFLGGTGPIEGVWFGDLHPTKTGRFWWREHLSKIDAITVGFAAAQKQGGAG